MLNPPYFPHFGRGMRWQDTGRGGTLYYPIWLSYATGVVEQKYQTRLVDAPACSWSREEVIDDIKRFKPDLIVIDSSFPSLSNDISIANEIKTNYAAAKTVLVGPPASQFPSDILNKGVDIVARYEYDLTLLDLAEKLEGDLGLESVKGISYREKGKIINNPNRSFATSEDLEKFPFVSKVYGKHLNINNYFLSSSLYPEVQIFTGRGCPFNCTFCSWPQTLMGRTYRLRSIADVLDELEWIQENLNVKEVFFEDDTFTINSERIIEFCKEYGKRDLDIVWSCNARVGLEYEIMKEMRKANCRLLIVGFESGSNEILRNIKKGITVAQIRGFAENARKAGLLVHGDFIIGLPGETKDTIKTTRKLIKEIKPDILQISVASPFPGTEFYEWCRKNGYLITDDPNEYLDECGHQKSVVSYPWLQAEAIVEEVNAILKEYYLSLSYVPVALRQVVRRHGPSEAGRLYRSARTFLRYVLSRAR